MMLNYTSGTTGDPKGVKVTQWGTLIDAYMGVVFAEADQDSVSISYLPSPHGFDQVLFALMLIVGGKVGYFQGDPLKLTEDCGVLQPTIFPSVPRLYNKIFAKIKTAFDSATGCKGWLIQKALAAKSANLSDSATYTHGCYDALVFKKVQALLGGRVKLMVTASAPISKEVLEFLKVCFSCPILEAYGLSETHGAATVTHRNDPTSGTVGGPALGFAIKLKDLPDMEYTQHDKPYPRGEVLIKGPAVFKGYFKNP